MSTPPDPRDGANEGPQARVELTKESDPAAGADASTAGADASTAGADARPEPDAPFDPYRFGLPDHPIPPEYAPPGYVPPRPPAGPASGPAPYAGGPRPGGPGPYAGGPGGWAPPTRTEYGPPPSGSGGSSNGKAVAALVLGILSIVFCIFSFLDLALIIPAVVLGSIALGESRRGRGGKGMAMAGVICAAVGAILAITVAVWLVPKVQHCQDYSSQSRQFRQCIEDQF